MKTYQKVSLFHILVVVPILGAVGWRIVNKEKVTDLEGYLLLLLAAIALVRHAQIMMS